MKKPPPPPVLVLSLTHCVGLPPACSITVLTSRDSPPPCFHQAGKVKVAFQVWQWQIDYLYSSAQTRSGGNIYLLSLARQTESRNSRGSDLGFLLTLSLDCYKRTMLIHFCPTQLISDLLNLALTHQVSQPGLDLQPGQASLMA